MAHHLSFLFHILFGSFCRLSQSSSIGEPAVAEALRNYFRMGETASLQAQSPDSSSNPTTLKTRAPKWKSCLLVSVPLLMMLLVCSLASLRFDEGTERPVVLDSKVANVDPTASHSNGRELLSLVPKTATSCSAATKLFIAIESSADDSAVRQAARETWLKWAAPSPGLGPSEDVVRGKPCFAINVQLCRFFRHKKNSQDSFLLHGEVQGSSVRYLFFTTDTVATRAEAKRHGDVVIFSAHGMPAEEWALVQDYNARQSAPRTSSTASRHRFTSFDPPGLDASSPERSSATRRSKVDLEGPAAATPSDGTAKRHPKLCRDDQAKFCANVSRPADASWLTFGSDEPCCAPLQVPKGGGAIDSCLFAFRGKISQACASDLAGEFFFFYLACVLWSSHQWPIDVFVHQLWRRRRSDHRHAIGRRQWAQATVPLSRHVHCRQKEN